jgi:tetratricopeptide (TPR) repeat protein
MRSKRRTRKWVDCGRAKIAASAFPLFIVALTVLWSTGALTQNLRAEAPPLVRQVSGAPFALQTFKTHSRISVQADLNLQSDLKVTPTGFSWLLKGISLNDIGAPLGAEQAWLKPLLGLNDGRVKSLKIDENETGLLVTGAWKFPVGRAALAEPRMEHFEYRDSQTGRWNLDFWVKPGRTALEESKVRRELQEKELQARSESESRKRTERKIAFEGWVEKENRVSQFCSVPVDEANSVFLPFYAVHAKLDLKRWFPEKLPDENYEYVTADTQEADAPYVRLALKLYREGKLALTLRTIDFFEKDHPASIYRREMRFLKANVQHKLGFETEAQRGWEEIMLNAPDSRAALNAGTFLAIKAWESGSALRSLEGFLWLIRHHPESRLNWVYHLAAAENLYSLKQTERAAKEYQWVAENAPTRKDQMEAVARSGDIYVARSQYERAVASYFQALNYYPKEADLFPSLHINRAEALYWLGQYDRSEEAFSDFLKKFPTHSDGWRATYRIGEIKGRGKGEAAQGESRKWYQETVNRFPFSPGSILAWLRLLPCGDHGGFDRRTADRFFEEYADRFDGGASVLMEKYPDFIALARVRMLSGMGDDRDAIEYAAKVLEGGSATEAKKSILGLSRKLFRRHLLSLLDQGKKFEALKFYNEQSARFPNSRLYGEQVVEPDYLLSLSKAAADLGLGQLAEDLSRQHQFADATWRSRVIASLEAVGAGDPGTSQLEKSERAFARLSALWVKRGVGATGSELAEMQTAMDEISDESSRSSYRELVRARFALADKRLEDAIRSLLRAKNLMVSTEAEVGRLSALIDAWIGKIQAEKKDWKAAAFSLESAFDRLRVVSSSSVGATPYLDQNLVPQSTVEEVSIRLAQVYEAKGEDSKAVSIYRTLVEKTEGRAVSEATLYAYGMALRRTRELAAAEKVFKDLRENGKDLGWKKLAGEALEE